MTRFLSEFKNFDVFGIDMRWNYHGNHKSRSQSGAVATLIFFALCLWVVISGAIRLIVKEDPGTSISQFFNPDPDPQEINSKTFRFAFGLQDGMQWEHFIDPSYYTVEASYRLSKRTKEGENVNFEFDNQHLTLETCTEEYFGVDIKQFESLEINKLFCLKEEQDIDIELTGTYESPIYKKLLFEVKRCDPEKSEIACKSEDEIDRKIEGSYFAIYYTDISVDPENFDHPGVGYRSSKFWMTSAAIRKEVYFYTKPINVYTDANILRENLDDQTLVTFDRAQETTAMNSAEVFFGLHMVASPNGVNYYRRYAKFSEVLAEVNGLATMFLIIMTFFVTPVQRYQFYRDFIAKRYKLCDPKLQKYRTSFTSTRFKKSLNLSKIDEEKFKGVLDDLRFSVFQNGQNVVHEKEEQIYLERLKKSASNLKAQETIRNQQTQLGLVDQFQVADTKVDVDKTNIDPNENNDQVKTSNDPEKKVSESPLIQLACSEANKLCQPRGETSDIELTLDIASQTEKTNQYISPRIVDSSPLKGHTEIKKASTIHPKEEILRTNNQEFAAQLNYSQHQRPNYLATIKSKTLNEDQQLNARTPFDRKGVGSVSEKFYTQFLESQKEQGIRLNLSLKNYLWSFMPCAKESKKNMRILFDMGHERIEEILDVDKLFQLRREVDLLKKIFISEDMEKYFEMIADDKIEIKREEFLTKIASNNKTTGSDPIKQ